MYQPQSLNKYQYCYNNPLAYTDADGHQIDAALKIGARAVASPNPVVRAVGIGILVAGGVAWIESQNLDAGVYHSDCVTCDAYTQDQLRQQQERAKQQAQENSYRSTYGQESTENDAIDPSGRIHAKGVTPEKKQNLADADRKGIPRDQLGPSGKPKVNTVKHPTKKEAKDAARAEGQGKPAHDAGPKKGGPHYHPTDKSGNRKKGKQNVHHEHPDKETKVS